MNFAFKSFAKVFVANTLLSKVYILEYSLVLLLALYSRWTSNKKNGAISLWKIMLFKLSVNPITTGWTSFTKITMESLQFVANPSIERLSCFFLHQSHGGSKHLKQIFEKIWFVSVFEFMFLRDHWLDFWYEVSMENLRLEQKFWIEIFFVLCFRILIVWRLQNRLLIFCPLPCSICFSPLLLAYLLPSGPQLKILWLWRMMRWKFQLFGSFHWNRQSPTLWKVLVILFYLVFQNCLPP